jgi:hypothetical protein
MFGDSTRQQTHTWKPRLLVLSACAPPDDPAGSKAELRSTPRLVRGSCPSSPPLRFPSLPGGSRPLWTHCCAEPGLPEPSLLQQRSWGEGGPDEGCRVAAGSCGTILCAPAEGFQLVAVEQSLFPIQSSRILTGFGGLHAENNPGT